MIRDHTSVNNQATALAKKLGMTPEASDTSKSLKSDGEKEIAKLKAMHGAEFDKAYIDNEVAYHESVIGALDKVLLPNAKNAELKSLLDSRSANLRLSPQPRQRDSSLSALNRFVNDDSCALSR